MKDLRVVRVMAVLSSANVSAEYDARIILGFSNRPLVLNMATTV